MSSSGRALSTDQGFLEAWRRKKLIAKSISVRDPHAVGARRSLGERGGLPLLSVGGGPLLRSLRRRRGPPRLVGGCGHLRVGRQLCGRRSGRGFGHTESTSDLGRGSSSASQSKKGGRGASLFARLLLGPTVSVGWPASSECPTCVRRTGLTRSSGCRGW